MFESLPFPPELFLHIFLWLAPGDLARVAQCNQVFYHLANDDHFWGTRASRDFGQYAAFFKRETTSRKEHYKSCFRFEKILARLAIDRSNQALINALYEDDILFALEFSGLLQIRLAIFIHYIKRRWLAGICASLKIQLL